MKRYPSPPLRIPQAEPRGNNGEGGQQSAAELSHVGSLSAMGTVPELD